jgi:hypothetical protein
LLHASAGLAQAKTSAAQTGAYDTQQLQAGFGQTQRGIASKLSQLGEREGLQTAVNTGKLRTEGRKEAAEGRKATREERSLSNSEKALAQKGQEGEADRRNRIETARISKGTGEPKLTTAEQNAALGELHQAATIAHGMLSSKKPPSVEQAKELLTNGVAAGQLKAAVKENRKEGIKAEPGSPAIPAFKNEAVVQAAIHLARYGTLDTNDVKDLESMGIKVPSQLAPRPETRVISKPTRAAQFAPAPLPQ